MQPVDMEKRQLLRPIRGELRIFTEKEYVECFLSIDNAYKHDHVKGWSYVTKTCNTTVTK